MRSWTNRFGGAFTGVVVIGLLSGCPDLQSQLDDALTYEFDTTSEVTVPGENNLTPGNPLAEDDVFPADFGDKLNEAMNNEFSTQDIDKDAVKSLKLIAMRIEVEDPGGTGGVVIRHLSWLESMSFSMSSEGAGPVEVAFSEPDVFDPVTEEDGTVIKVIDYDFEVTENELVDVLKGGDAMTMDTAFETQAAPNDAPDFDTTVTFTVTMRGTADAAGAAGVN